MTTEPPALEINQAAIGTPPDREVAHADFVNRHYEGVYRWLWWQCRCPEIAADLTQDAFAAFWQSQGRTRIRQPRIWLYRIARNHWRKWVRDRRDIDGLPSDLPGAGGDAETSAVRAEASRRVVDAVASLPPSYRDVVLLRFGGDLSYFEIARILEIPAVLARWRGHQARQRLRATLQPDEVHDDTA